MLYNFGRRIAIGRLLKEDLLEKEFNDLVYSYFPDVFNQFTSGQTKNQKVRLLIEYADKHKEIDKLLEAIKNINLKVYQKYKIEQLLEALPEEEFNDLVYNYFPDVYNQFTNGQNKNKRVILLIEYADNHGEIEQLIEAIELEALPEKEFNDLFYSYFLYIEQLLEKNKNNENEQTNSIEEVKVQVFIDMSNGPNLNKNTPGLLEFCTGLTPDVYDMSYEIDNYIRNIVGHVNGSITNKNHPLLLEYEARVKNYLKAGVSQKFFYLRCHASLDINNKTGQEIKDIIIAKNQG